jgi:TonB family protein
MSETARLWEGQMVAGKFELRAYLGGSERGCVFLTGSEAQQAVIKLIRANETEAEDQLLRWAQTASLSHPHLVQLFETGRCRIGDTDLVYVVMERADETLAEILPQRALSPTEVGEMLPPVLDALAYLHGQGFAHGCMKPSNILAVGDQVKISSDGICPIGAEPGRLDVYDAPETANGRRSAAADLWSLGMTLAEALTQQAPRWQESNRDDPLFSGPMPQPFLDVARNCLRRDPRHRCTISDISARLRSSSHAPEVEAVPPEIRREIIPPRAATHWRQMVPGTVLITLALMVIFVAPKIRDRFHNRRGEVAAFEPTPSAEKTKKSPSPSLGQAETDKPRTQTAFDEVTKPVMPEVPQKARDTIRGTVKVGIRVEVGPSGEVTAVSIDSPGPSSYFANLAVSAARQWRFVSTAADGGSADRTWILRFEFTQGATKVFPARLRK